MNAVAHHRRTVLMIAPLFPPQNVAGVHRTVRFVRYLERFGWRAIVITKAWDKGAGREEVSPQLPEGTEVVSVIDPVHRTVVSSESPSPECASDDRHGKPAGAIKAAKSFLRPAWQLITETPDLHRAWSARAAIKAIELCRTRDIDVLYTTSPPHSTHLAGRQVALKTGVPWVADFRDPWARKTWQKKKNPWGKKLTPFLEKRVVSVAQRVIANTDASLASFQAAYPVHWREKFELIPNGFDPAWLPEVSSAQEAGSPRNGSATPVVICHPGSLYGERSPVGLMQAIAMLRRDGIPIQLQQIGHCNPEYNPVAMAEQLTIRGAAEWIAHMPQSDVMKAMSAADLLLLIQPNAPFQVPGKLFEMLLFEQPIVAVCDSPPTARIVEDAGGVIAPSNDVSRIAEAIRHALTMRGSDTLRQKRLAARRQFDGVALTERLAQMFGQIARAPTHA